MMTAAATPRKGAARVLKRKTSHSVIERRRREKINEGLIHLQSTVPACRLELRELLECKVRNKKKAKSKDEVQVQVDKLLEDKSNSEMVLEKLVSCASRISRRYVYSCFEAMIQCIISHTVDYVQELQNKVDAYRRWCRCSPPLPNAPQTLSHDQAHIPPPGLVSMSNIDKGPGCNGCSTSVTGKRHWGSNHPLRLSRDTTAIIGAARGDTNDNGAIHQSHQQVIAARASTSQDINNLIECDCQDQSSDLELEEWHESNNRLLATARVCSHDHDCARLGLLAQVSAEKERVPSPE
jgi:hypothetical protein